MLFKCEHSRLQSALLCFSSSFLLSGCVIGGASLNLDPLATLGKAKPSPTPSATAPAGAGSSFSDSKSALVPGDFSYNGSLVTFSGANAEAVAIQFVDNSAATFGAGTHSTTQWNAGSGWLDLVSPSGNTSGSFTSRIIDSTNTGASWSSFAFTTSRPAHKPLPNSGATETAYTTGNVAMNSNTMLLHLDETSISGGGTFDGADGSGVGNPATAVPSTLTLSTSGKYKNALSTDGMGAGLKVAHSTSVDPKTAFSAELWFKPTATFSSTTNWSQSLLDQGTWGLRLDQTDGKLKTWMHSTTALSATTALTTSIPLGWNFQFYNEALYYGVENSGSVAAIDLYICQHGGDNRCDLTDFSLSFADATHTAVRSFAVYNNKLYLGMGNTSNGGGDIYVCANTASGGNASHCDNTADFATAFNDASGYLYATSMIVYRDALYAAFDGGAAGAGIYRCTSTAGGGNAQYCDTTDWVQIYSVAGATYQSASSFAVFNDRLYVGMGTLSGQGDVLMCNPAGGGVATDCDNQADFVSSYNGTGATALQINSLTIFNGYLYAGIEGSSAGDGKVLICTPATTSVTTTCESGDWVAASTVGGHESVESMTSFQGKLIASFGWNTNLGDIYACTPANGQYCVASDWASIYAGSGAGYDTVSALYDYNGYLYAATGNGTNNAAVLRFGTLANVLSTFTSWASGTWFHAAITYDGTTLKLYRNGSLANSTALAITPASANIPLYIGKALGSRGESSAHEDGFNGLIDEVALFDRTLSASEVTEHYKRGALRLRFQVRSCDDAACVGETWIGSDGTAATVFSEQTNTSITPTASYSFTASNNRYFQYLALLASEVSGDSPNLGSLTVLPTHYDSTSPTLTTITGISFLSLTGFSETLGGSHTGSTTYQLSPDGTTWYYWTGATWATASGVAQSNSATVINSQISLYQAIAGGTQLFVKTFLTSSNSNLRPQWQSFTASGLR